MKKIFLISGLVAVAFALLVGIYFWLAGGGSETQVPPPSSQNMDTIPSDQAAKIVSETALAGYTIRNGSVVGIGEDGQVFEIKGSEKTFLNEATLGSAILDLSFSADKNWFLEKWGSEQNPQFSVFDIRNKRWIQLGENIVAAAWSPALPELLIAEASNNGAALGILALTESPSAGFVKRSLGQISLFDFRVDWVTPEKIIIGGTPSSQIENILFEYDLKTQSFKKFAEGLGLHGLWNKPNNMGLLHFSNGSFVINIDGALLLDVGIVALPAKCEFGDVLLYCATPRNVPQNISLPDDYLKKIFYSNDVLVSIDVETGEYKTSTLGLDVVDAVNLQVLNGSLYFINRYDKKLYELSL